MEMKTEQINCLMGIILKGVTIISIITLTITFLKWQNTNIGAEKYQFTRQEGGLTLFNPKTGEVLMFFSDNDSSYRRKLDLLNKDINKVYGKKESTPHPPYN